MERRHLGALLAYNTIQPDSSAADLDRNFQRPYGRTAKTWKERFIQRLETRWFVLDPLRLCPLTLDTLLIRIGNPGSPCVFFILSEPEHKVVSAHEEVYIISLPKLSSTLSLIMNQFE